MVGFQRNSIENKPRVNMDPKDELLKQYEEEIQKLRQIIEMSKQGQHISAQDLGESIKMLNRDQNILMGGKSSHKDESVEELLQKLAKKGKKVKLLEESISTKEQKIKNKDQNLDEVEDLERDSIEDEDEIEQEVQSTKNSKNRNEPSNFKQKSNKAKKTKDCDIDQEDIQIEGEENNIQAHQLLEKQKHQLKIIEQTNQQLQEEAKKREELQMILKQMEERLVSGGNALQEKEREQYQAQRKLQLELEKEKQIQQQLLQEREQQEAEFLEKEKHYNSMQEEVQDGRKIIKKLRQKLKNAQNELKDIHKENLEKNEELLDTVREQAKELDFLNQLTGFLVTDEQMYQIKEKTEWDDERRKWRLPPFIIKQKEVQFPKLGNNTKAYLQEELDNNEIQFQNLNQSSLFSDSQMNGGGSLNGQVNQRRTNGFGHRGGNNNQNNIQRGANDQSQNFIGNKGIPNGNNNTYISSKDLRNDNLSSRANQELIKMTRNESKNSQGFAIGNQQKRNNLRMNNENYLESPEVSQKKQNNKAGVQLAPLGTQHHQIGNGRSSLMSIKGLEENEGSESHPILRVQNYKKPLLDKQILPNGGIPQYNMEFFDEKQSQIDLNNILNSKKKGSRKRENAQLAPLNHAPHKLLVGSHSQMSNNPI